MKARGVFYCGLCGGENLEKVLDLGSSPPTCVMTPVDTRRVEESHFPLEVLVCKDCTLAQLSVVVDPEVMFPVDYPYSSGNSRALHQNFEDLAERASVYLTEPDDLVVDLGANDGTLLSKFPHSSAGARVGVEPTKQGVSIEGEWYRDFFDIDLATEIRKYHGPAKVITACNVLAHVDDINEVMSAITTLLADDGVLIAENHDLASVVDGGQWDTVYHEHLRFFDPFSFEALLERYGLMARSWHDIPTHGGSFRMIAGKGLGHEVPKRRKYNFPRLQRLAERARQDLRAGAVNVVGIGATARATTIINYCGLDVEDVEYVCEVAGSDKIGHYIPGTRIPVVDEERLFEDQQDAVLFSWHMADLIVPKLRERGYTGEVIVPLPTPAYV